MTINRIILNIEELISETDKRLCNDNCDCCFKGFCLYNSLDKLRNDIIEVKEKIRNAINDD